MFSAFANMWKVPELRARLIFTLAMVVVVRIGAAVTAPGVNANVLHEWFLHEVNNRSGGSVAALFNIFSGGALENCAVFSLGIMPYISASIMLQLLTAVVPQLGKLAREDGGRQKITQYTRYATVALCVFQGYLLARTFENPSQNPFLTNIQDTINRLGTPLVANPGPGFRIITIICLTAGTMLLMWIGDQMTDRGVGNGVSLIITVGIVAQLPAALIQAWRTFVPTQGGSQVSPIVLVLMLAFLILVVAAVIAVTQAQRKIVVQYARRVVGRKMYGGQSQTLPLKVNYAGVMPIIFAQALLVFPSQILTMLFHNAPWAQSLSNNLTQGWLYYTLYSLMIFFFSYFWVATQFQPGQIADDLKKNGGYIAGVRPGKPTADFLDFTMTRLTFAGAVFLVVIAVLPQLLARGLQVPYITAQFFGGTGLLIIVGVMLDTMRQVETHLIQKHYDGFLRKGKIRGRFDRMAAISESETRSQGLTVMVCVGVALLLIGALAMFLSH